MKCTVMVCLLFAAQLHAQESAKKLTRFSYGVTLGSTLSRLQFTDDWVGSLYRSTPILGIRSGVIVKFNASKSVFFTGGVVYSGEKSTLTQANAFSFPGTYSEQITQRNLNWIDLPLTFNYVINSKSKTQAFIGAGIIGKKLLASKMIFTTNILDATTNTISSATIEYSGTDFFENVNAFGCLSSGVQFLGKHNGALILSISIERSLFEIAKLRPTDPQVLFDYGVITPQLKITNFSLNITYAVR